MEKKFFDIVPPSEEGDFPKTIVLKKNFSDKKSMGGESLSNGVGSERPHGKILSGDAQPGFEQVTEAKEPEKVIKKRSPFKTFLKFALVAVVLLVIASFGFMWFSEIKIGIKPKIDSASFNASLIVDTAFSGSDSNSFLEKGQIPGKIFEDTKSISDSFSATGKIKKEAKAKGTITVYNGYSTSPRTLIKSRFVSADGKLFWSTKEVTVPGATNEKGKLVPGEITVEVEAAKAGEDYNIGPTTFALPGLAGTPSYTSVYAKSFSPMTGGFSGEVPQVTKDDLDKAESALLSKINAESLASLKNSIPKDYSFLDSAILQGISEKKSSQEVGSQADSFNYELKVFSRAIGFSKKDIENFSQKYILSKVAEGRKILDGSLRIEYSVTSVDWDAKKAVIEIKITAETYLDIDMMLLKKSLAGKNYSEANSILDKIPEKESYYLKNFWFWRGHIPDNLDDFEAKLIL